MSWVPGAPLGDAPLSSAQAQALAAVLGRLWRCVNPARNPFPWNDRNAARLISQVRARLVTGPEMGDDSLVRAAGEAAAAWLASDAPDRLAFADDDVVLGQGDCNLANFLWDGTQVRLVDFEDSGLSDRAFELAILVEHISAWSEVSLEAEPFVALFDLTASERLRLREFRRLAAFFWLLLLLPGGPAFCRNPPGTLGRQAHRLLTLLG